MTTPNGSASTARVSARPWPLPGQKKAGGTGGQASEALGRSRRGFGSKIHAAVNSLGHPVRLRLTGSEAADSPHLPGLIAGVPAQAALAELEADIGEIGYLG